MKRFTTLFFLLAALNCSLQAQVKKKIKRGRRNKSESQFMLEKDYLQAEWETGKETISDKLSTAIYPNLLIRYGLSKRMEVNTEMNFITAIDKSNGIKKTSGVEPVLFGINYLVAGERKNEPAIIVSAQLAAPYLASKNFKANYWAPLIQINFQQPIQKWILGVSTGAFWDGFGTSPSFIYNATAAVNINPRWTLSSEWFGFINGSPPQHNTDIGITYNLNKHIQFGATAGTGISSAAHKSYFAVNGVWGYSCRKKRQPAT